MINNFFFVFADGLKMSKNVIKFDNVEIEKYKFHYSKHSMNIDKENVKIIVISNKVLVGSKALKYFIAQKHVHKITPLCIKLPKMNRNKKCFGKTIYVSCSIKDGEIVKNCNKIWYKVTNIIKKGFHKEPVGDGKYLNIKRPYVANINSSFHNNKMFKEGSRFVCISTVLIDSVFRLFSLKYFWKNVYMFIKKKEMAKSIRDELENSSEKSDEEVFGVC